MMILLAITPIKLQVFVTATSPFLYSIGIMWWQAELAWLCAQPHVQAIREADGTVRPWCTLCDMDCDRMHLNGRRHRGYVAWGFAPAVPAPAAAPPAAVPVKAPPAAVPVKAPPAAVPPPVAAQPAAVHTPAVDAQPVAAVHTPMDAQPVAAPAVAATHTPVDAQPVAAPAAAAVPTPVDAPTAAPPAAVPAGQYSSETVWEAYWQGFRDGVFQQEVFGHKGKLIKGKGKGKGKDIKGKTNQGKGNTGKDTKGKQKRQRGHRLAAYKLSITGP